MLFSDWTDRSVIPDATSESEIQRVTVRVLTFACAILSLFCFCPTVMAQFKEPEPLGDLPVAQSGLATMAISKHTASGSSLGNGVYAINCAACYCVRIPVIETGPWSVSAAIDTELNPQGTRRLWGVKYFDMEDFEKVVLPGQTVIWGLGTCTPSPSGPAGSYSSHAFLAGSGPSGYTGSPTSIVRFSL
jgi:hypothetical protein